MTLDEIFDPNKNEHFAEMLRREGFDFEGVKVREFINPMTEEVCAAVLTRDGKDVVLALVPGKGTSVLKHSREKTEEVTYLGSIVDGESPVLKYKFQDTTDSERVEGHDIVRDYRPGDKFVTIGEGINGKYHGYHDVHPTSPIAIRIKKQF